MSRPGTLSHREPISPRTSAIQSRLRGAEVTHSVCPYCAIGCGLLVFTKGKRPIAIEGNPDSPVNQGRLCPKGANTLQLVANPHRVTTVKYRAPYSDRWEERSIDWAMDRIARLTKQTRDATFVETAKMTFEDGEAERRVNHTRAIVSLGGATMDIEWNYVQAKLMRALGVIGIENQARI